MKDYFDLRALVREGRADTNVLIDAIGATFDRRGTLIPTGIPLGLSDEFAANPSKIAQWKGFLDRNRLVALPLPDVVSEIRTAMEEAMRFARERSARP